MANDMKELTHTLEIIQNKLKACQEEQRLKLNKMTTKRVLLGESVEVLQNSLGSSLKQDFRKQPYHGINVKGQEPQWTPIIGDAFDVQDTEEEPLKEKLKLIQCKGWIRDNRRVWIQAQALCLSNDIDQAHLSSIPNTMTETMYVNSVHEFKENTVIQFFMAFQPLEDSELHSLKIACTIDNRYMSSLSSIEWINGSSDLTWKEQMLLMSIPNVIQAYFPCHIRIVNHKDNKGIMDSLIKDMIPLTRHLYLSKDQLYLFNYEEKEDDIHLYGLNHGIVAKTASQFAHLSTAGITTKKELIKSLGEQCVTLEHNQLNQTRLQTALLLSEMTK